MEPWTALPPKSECSPEMLRLGWGGLERVCLVRAGDRGTSMSPVLRKCRDVYSELVLISCLRTSGRHPPA